MTPEESIAWHPTHPGGSTDILPAFADILLPKVPVGGTYVEIGTFFGRSLSFVGLTRPDLQIVAVDPWENTFVDAGEVLPVGPDLELCRKHGGLFSAFVAMMTEHAQDVLDRVRLIREPSATGLAQIASASVDMCFVDGDHAFDAVVRDCEEAIRIVKPGGIIAGHDMGWGPTQGVTRAVYKVFGKYETELCPWPVARDGWAPGKSSVWWKVA